MLDFDQEAFLAASLSNATETEDFFLSRNVLTEGTRIRCRDPTGPLVRSERKLAAMKSETYLGTCRFKACISL